MKLIVSETSNNTSSCSTSRDEPVGPIRSSVMTKRVTFPDEDTMTSLDDQIDVADTSFVSITTTSSIVDNRIMKRKIARKIPITSSSTSPPPSHHQQLKRKSTNQERLNDIEQEFKNLNLKQTNMSVSPIKTRIVQPLTNVVVDDCDDDDDDSRIDPNDESESTAVDNQYYSDDENYFRLVYNV